HVAVPAAAGLVRTDKQVAHDDLEELLLLRARLTADQRALLEVLAARTGEHQLRAGLAVLHHEVEVLHVDLARATTTTGREGAALRGAPAPRLQVNPALLGLVRRLAVDAFDLQEIVYVRHGPYSLDEKRSAVRG